MIVYGYTKPTLTNTQVNLGGLVIRSLSNLV
jgi:hypothetical protein